MIKIRIYQSLTVTYFRNIRVKNIYHSIYPIKYTSWCILKANFCQFFHNGSRVY
jgi:hypothetical protein